jgi:hypothetical protein
MDLPDVRWAKKAMEEHMSLTWHSPYWEYVCKIKYKIALPYLHSKQMIKLHLDSFFLNQLNESIVTANLPAFRPVTRLTRATYVTESPLSAIIAGIKVNYCRGVQCQGNNRARRCPHCPGVPAPKSSEFHVAWVCPSVAQSRLEAGITMFSNMCRLKDMSKEDSFYNYVNGLDVDGKEIALQEIMDRAESLKKVRDKWNVMFPQL